MFEKPTEILPHNRVFSIEFTKATLMNVIKHRLTQLQDKVTSFFFATKLPFS